jgi:hypothetical protein
VPKQPNLYYQADIARKDLVILREKKQQNDSRNIVAIIVLLPLLLFSPPLIPEPNESKIPAKYLDHKPKALDLFDLTEPKLNTPRKQFILRFLGYIIY